MSCILAITATATRSTAVSVSTHLGIAEEDIIRGTALPENLKITVSCAADKDKVPIVLRVCSMVVACAYVSPNSPLAGPGAAAAGACLQLPVLNHCVLH